MNNTDDVKKALIEISEQITNYSELLKSQVANGQDFMASSHELTKHVMSLVYTTGEYYAAKPVTVKVSNPSNNYRHSLRGAKGRFIAKPKAV